MIHPNLLSPSPTPASKFIPYTAALSAPPSPLTPNSPSFGFLADWHSREGEDDEEENLENEKRSEELENGLSSEDLFFDVPKESKRFQRIIWILIAGAMWIAGIILGKTLNEDYFPSDFFSRFRQTGAEHDSYSAFAQPGILLVDTAIPENNKWMPLVGNGPVEYMRMLRDNQTVYEELEFMRNKFIAIMGDSVDREHVEHICRFTYGKLELISKDHHLSPPLPEGKEDRPGHNPGTGWQDNQSGRPYLCTIERYNLRILNVFSFGLSNEDNWLRYDTKHFYPPGKLEDRFRQILLPLLHSLIGDTPPDLFSMTAGFWDLYRFNVYSTNKWAELSWDRMNWSHESIREAIEGVIDYWPGNKPTILLRSLHHICENEMQPFNRIQSIDAIARSVVSELIHGSNHLASPPSPFQISKSERDLAQIRVENSTMSKFILEQDRHGRTGPSLEVMRWTRSGSTSPSRGLENRLKIDNWGKLMLGQEKHFRDSIHPKPLPGGYLYADMLFQQLKDASL